MLLYTAILLLWMTSMNEWRSQQAKRRFFFILLWMNTFRGGGSEMPTLNSFPWFKKWCIKTIFRASSSDPMARFIKVVHPKVGRYKTNCRWCGYNTNYRWCGQMSFAVYTFHSQVLVSYIHRQSRIHNSIFIVKVEYTSRTEFSPCSHVGHLSVQQWWEGRWRNEWETKEWKGPHATVNLAFLHGPPSPVTKLGW